ncbi:hypothetical protein BC835DRAFT_1418109 [Cytidiella melzeri]|nr:hypothetical protein BC835DRAFT_1418109 [Cytidiella melzeri]
MPSTGLFKITLTRGTALSHGPEKLGGSQLHHAKRRLRFTKKRDRRGWFLTIATGLSYGGGQTKPGLLRHSKHNQKVLQELLNNPNVRRVLGYGNSAFLFYFPKIYAEYANNMDGFWTTTELSTSHTELVLPGVIQLRP